MRLISRRLIPVLALLICCTTFLSARKATNDVPTKQFDLTKYHNVGNIWLRVSNYGFFGSGDDISPQYPSLEYPGGSGIDYLYQGALWFGAVKYRRNAAGERLFWQANQISADNDEVYAESELPADYNGAGIVYDTLVTVGFDGDADLYEFLPAYNPLENNNQAVETFFGSYNADDHIITASTRDQKRGVDDDGDGRVDEDFVGYTFPMRTVVEGNELPENFASLSGLYMDEMDAADIATILDPANNSIWFPLGFMDLGVTDENGYFNFATPYDDDGDGRVDEDGAPVSEQDFISYYYDYSPFGYEGQRDWGGSKSNSEHYPLNIRVRQMSYQWSYEYIKNLVYVEFNITNMNEADTLFNCAMGIYMDSDVGPQSWDSEKASDDKSGYQKGENYEFAYTKDADGDGGLTTGLVGSRVCSPIPDPADLNYSCWYWEVGDGPYDEDPRSLNTGNRKTNNEKYYLLKGENPDSDKYTSLRSANQDHFIQEDENDTRYLFAFSGFPDSSDEEKIWNLAPKKTMKIVIAIFPGDNLEELKASASWAKRIYKDGQSLTNVVLPDTVKHYSPPTPPEIPGLYAEVTEDGNQIEYYWDNRSIYSYDIDNVDKSLVGWQDVNDGVDSYVDNWDQWSEIYGDLDNLVPSEVYDQDTYHVNPVTAYRLRHDFQGYRVWIRSGSGSQEDWSLVDMWGKVETEQDEDDYNVNENTTTLEGGEVYKDYGGYTAIDTGLPNERTATEEDTHYITFNEYYRFRNIEVGETIYGLQLYKYDLPSLSELQAEADQLLGSVTGSTMIPDDLKADVAFKLFARSEDNCPEGLTYEKYESIFKALYEEKLIPLSGFGGQSAAGNDEMLEELSNLRLSRRFYHHTVNVPRKGVETYVAVTAFDRGMPSQKLSFLETGRDADANMKVFFPAPNRADFDGSEVYVVPNPYIGRSDFDGRRESDEKGDKSKRIWFVNLPSRAKVKIYTLAGDLVDEFDHEGAYQEDVITVSKAASVGTTTESIHAWNLLSKNNQIIAPGVYLFSVKDKASGDVHVGKFVLIK